VRDASDTYTYGYDQDNRLVTASLNGSVVGSYLTNAFGQRAVKSASGVTTHFLYDTFGHLIAEANGATGAILREYVWLDNMPVALVDETGASPVIYYIHTDQLGTPQKVTDATTAIVWNGLFDPFGNAVTIAGGNWGSGLWGTMLWGTAPNTFHQPLRFPGQYADPETALNQNWFRDYDPSIGRYIESDPIGLESGPNTYAYVLNDPNQLIDADGTGITGAIVGGIIGGLVASESGPGAIAAALEGAELGSDIEDALAIATQNNKISVRCMPRQCQIQYDRDTEICGNLRTNGARGRCRESASERLAHCINSNGEVGWPPLQTR
jgi:RHS repeat-associated protein